MKRLVVLGAGESGAGAAVLGKVKGYDVFVSDMSKIKDNYKIRNINGYYRSFILFFYIDQPVSLLACSFQRALDCTWFRQRRFLRA